MRSTLASLAALLLAACYPSIESLQALSAGSIGCPQNEVGISNQQEVNSSTTSWQADCRGRSFVCSVSGRHEIACSPMLAPVVTAPPMAPEAVAKACAEAVEYDKKAAAADSPAKEQYEKMAAHQHRDCTAGQAPAPAPMPPASAAPPASPAPPAP